LILKKNICYVLNSQYVILNVYSFESFSFRLFEDKGY